MAFLKSNQLSIPFRQSAHLSLSNSLCRYITDKYNQHPDVFREDLSVIDALRHDAVNVYEAHPSGIKKLQAYAAQLAWISGKFPVEVGAEFTWYPALGYNVERPIVEDNLQFEIINILYNLAALYCQLAVGTSHTDADGLKAAASYYVQAAGVFKHIREKLLVDPDVTAANLPDDLDAATLDALEELMLAQAQECFWMRAVNERYKDATIAKLAARLSDLYNAAGEAAVRSDAISRAWIHHMSAKHHHFAAAAQYRASLDCLEKRRYGEEVARLQDALQCATEGLKEGRGGLLSKPVQEDLQNLKKRVEDDLKRAEKDNDIIYLNVVPAKSELRILDRASMALSRTPPQVEKPLDFLGDGTEFGTPLFAKLVPFAVYLAVSVYEERRDRLVNQNIIRDLEALTEQLHESLISLNLPGSLQAIERPLGLPGTLSQHAEEIRYADVLNKVQRSFADIDKLRASDRATFDEGKAMLEVEDDEDTQLRQRHGTERWTRPEGKADAQGQKLWKNAVEIEGYFSSSGSSDAVVRDMFASVKDMLGLLAGSDRALLDFVPNSRKVDISEMVKPALGRLRGVYNDVLRMESRRRKRVEMLHEKARGDDVKPDMMKETARLERTYANTPIVASHFDSFFASRLRDLYGEDQGVVDKEREEQERLLEDVARANRDFEAQKRASGDRGSREREAVLQKLDTAYYKYKEIVKNVEVGRKFYNDLGRIAGSFRDQCRTWLQQRRAEAQSLEEELSMPVLSSLSLDQRSAQSSVPPPPAPAPAPAPTVQQVSSHASHATHASLSSQDQSAMPPPQQQSSIQSWATSGPPHHHLAMFPPAIQQQQQQQQQQRQNQAPQQQTWSPGVAIQFGTPSMSVSQQKMPGASATGNRTPGTWDPSSGIRFG
ncbi:pH signal transduction protein [Grosmannia clavigera kw1407]|uniref:pH signal transduction protein n=1 Tax=Grosmannia clavigera (strain kw1407 / UAMH 11150) TaxID=655863 RepID=F0X733_GROCL|nr:pH signal transduction protein [Grosmannia clavigera kw1407]EFX06308.1 pH signal transduction protein [Grosmannia clavigera kw1407]